MKFWAALLLIATLAGVACPAMAETYIVAIDVGHTKASPGAISVTGQPEYEFNLRIAQRLEETLRTKSPNDPNTIKSFIISSEKPMALTTRTKIATKRNADLFVSIHHDSAQDQYLEEREVNGQEQRFTDEFSGYSIFVSRKNQRYDESLELAKRIGRAMKSANFPFARHHHQRIPGENRPYADEEAGVYAFDDLVVLKTATMPAVLVECGVIVNPKEEQDLLTKKRQATIVAQIVRGIRDYFANAVVIPRPERNDAIETSSPAPTTRYPKPGTTPSPARDN